MLPIHNNIYNKDLFNKLNIIYLNEIRITFIQWIFFY